MPFARFDAGPETGGFQIMPTTIGDALGIDYRGAEANISHVGRAGHSFKELTIGFQIPSPTIHAPGPSISAMNAKEGSGSPGDNLDVWA